MLLSDAYEVFLLDISSLLHLKLSVNDIFCAKLMRNSDY